MVPLETPTPRSSSRLSTETPRSEGWRVQAWGECSTPNEARDDATPSSWATVKKGRRGPILLRHPVADAPKLADARRPD